MAYDSRPETFAHSLRVGELMGQPIRELVDRSVKHDLSKTEDPELAVFDEYTPKLKDTTYGSDEYKGYLAAMGEGLRHHYAANRHHPEHFAGGVDDMTLVDLVEMLADWKAATERHADGDLATSLNIQHERFGISDQLAQILRNTAGHFGWITSPASKPYVEPGICRAIGEAPNGDRLICDQVFGHDGEHCAGAMDNMWWRDGEIARS
jgi:hypothetical protein